MDGDGEGGGQNIGYNTLPDGEDGGGGRGGGMDEEQGEVSELVFV